MIKNNPEYRNLSLLLSKLVRKSLELQDTVKATHPVGAILDLNKRVAAAIELLGYSAPSKYELRE